MVNAPLHADTSGFVNYEWHEFELDSFENSIDSLHVNRPRTQLYHRFTQNRFLDPVRYATGAKLFIERKPLFDPRLLELGPGARLRGFFQSPKYFPTVADKVRQQTANIDSPTSWYLETCAQLDELGPWLGVHVRRGNYTTVPGMGLADFSYYSEAIQLVGKCVGSLPTVVFSDDPTEAANILRPSLGGNWLLIKSPENSRPIESMNLMRRAAHLVIANSTFGWWGAWLGDSPERMVIYPRPWLDFRWHNDRDLIPTGWISVSR